MNRKNFISTLGTATAGSIVGVGVAKGNTTGSPNTFFIPKHGSGNT